MSAAASDPAGRHRGRVAALQLLYQREVGGGDGPRRSGLARARPQQLPRSSHESAGRSGHRREVGGGDGPRFDHAVGLYWREHPAPDGPRRFAERLLRGTLDALDRIDPLIESAADHWRLSRMAVIDRLVLRLAVYELLAAETPAPVVIDEAIELARTFGDEPSPRFVNGVLDAVRRGLDGDRRETGRPAP